MNIPNTSQNHGKIIAVLPSGIAANLRNFAALDTFWTHRQEMTLNYCAKYLIW